MAGWTSSVKVMYGGKPTDIMQVPSSFWNSNQSSSSSSASSSSPEVPRLQAPSLTPPTFSTDTTSYPTYLRNLGENAAQQAFQRATNRISAGNSQQNYMHAQDRLNQERLGYMSQAGRENLAVDNAINDAWAKNNALLAQLYGIDASQRNTDVGAASNRYAADQRLAGSGGGIMYLGGGSRGGGGTTSSGTYTNIQGDVFNGRTGSYMGTPGMSSMNPSSRAYLDRGYF